jgi:hypothetical protein
MEDYYQDGKNIGRGKSYLNTGHDFPQTESEKYSFRQGIEDGERQRKYSQEFDENE